MNNISFRGESIHLVSDSTYYIIDLLYFNKIKKTIDQIDINLFEEEVKSKIFPYADSPFGKFLVPKFSSKSEISFEIDYIVKANPNDQSPECFSCDSGFVLIIEKGIFFYVLKHFDLEMLLNSPLEPINTAEWVKIVALCKKNTIALINAPGINTKFDFDGSGYFKVSFPGYSKYK